MHGLVHFDFAAADVQALADFYTKVFGWNQTPMFEGYILWSVGEGDARQGGGFRKFEADEPQGPSSRIVCYIEVEDIEATLATIGANGGSTMIPKTEIGGGHGFFAWFTDPAGNTAALWSK
jgi:predicted enzyme related to lactoylglutathione lyase